MERLKAAGSTKAYLLFKRPSGKDSNVLAAAAPKDEEEAIDAQPKDKQASGDKSKDIKLQKTSTVFTWDSLNYTVPVTGGSRQLLSNVKGYTKPGALQGRTPSDWWLELTCIP